MKKTNHYMLQYDASPTTRI